MIAVDPDQRRLDAALRLGASVAVVVGDDVRDEVRAVTEGEMADYVFVATAAVSAIETGFDLLARMGTLVLVGMPPSGARVSLDPVTVASAGQRILGSKMGSPCLPGIFLHWSPSTGRAAWNWMALSRPATHSRRSRRPSGRPAGVMPCAT